MIITSQSPAYQLFAQSLTKYRSSGKEEVTDTTSPSSSVVNTKQDSSSVEAAPDNNIKSAIGQALVFENEEKSASATREVEVDSSYAETLRLLNGFGDGRIVVAEMSKDSTAERPEVYLELRENNETKAYLIDLNKIDPSRMTRIEALALTQHMTHRDDFEQPTRAYELTASGESIISGDSGDWTGWWSIINMASGFWGKNPFDHVDYYGPDSLDEEINFYQLVQSGLSQTDYIPQDALDSIGGYLGKLENNEALSASDKMKGMLDLLQALNDVRDYFDAAIRMKGVDKLADMLETSPAAVYSWMGGTGQFADADETDVSNERDAGALQDFTGLLRKARIEMYSNETHTDEYDWWNDDKDEK